MSDFRQQMPDFNIDPKKVGKYVLIGVSSLHTGYDAPDIECVLNCRPTKRRGLFSQMVGRGLRVHPEGRDAIHLDCARATERFGLYDMEFEPWATKEDAVSYMKMHGDKVVPHATYMTTLNNTGLSWVTYDNIESSAKSAEEGVSLEALKYQFDHTNDAIELLNLGCRIYEKVYNVETKPATKEWILTTMIGGVKRHGIKSYRGRLRNIIKDGKKIAGIHYFTEWLDKNKFY